LVFVLVKESYYVQDVLRIVRNAILHYALIAVKILIARFVMKITQILIDHAPQIEVHFRSAA
jgi:hypothetical protein